MHISWHGHYTVKLVTKINTIILDPHSPTTGLTPLRSKATIIALSNPASQDMSHLSGIQGDPLIIDRPGEYALSDITLYARGWHTKDGTEQTIQRWHIDDMVLLHVGALNRKLEQAELQELEQSDIDVLLLPIGGGNGLTTAQALELLTTIEPRVVLPIHYKIPKVTEKLGSVDQFAKEMGISPKKKEAKAMLTAKKLDAEGLATMILSP